MSVMESSKCDECEQRGMWSSTKHLTMKVRCVGLKEADTRLTTIGRLSTLPILSVFAIFLSDNVIGFIDVDEAGLVGR